MKVKLKNKERSCLYIIISGKGHNRICTVNVFLINFFVLIVKVFFCNHMGKPPENEVIFAQVKKGAPTGQYLPKGAL